MIPSLSDWETKAGDILITSNNLISSTLLIEKELPLTVGVLLDFCTLIKALTFHDRIIVLPADTGAYEDKLLFKYLKERKILYAVNKHIGSALNSEFLGDLVGKKTSKERIIAEWDILFHYAYRSGIDWLAERHNRIVDNIISDKDYLTQTLFNDLNLLYGGKDRVYRYRLRTAIYYELSNYLNLPFLPDFTRIPILLNYNAKITESFHDD